MCSINLLPKIATLMRIVEYQNSDTPLSKASNVERPKLLKKKKKKATMQKVCNSKGMIWKGKITNERRSLY